MHTTPTFLLVALAAWLAVDTIRASDKLLIEPQWEGVEASFAESKTVVVDVVKDERIIFRYCPIADSGVEVELVQGNVVLWRKHVEPLGIEHSRYQHAVSLQVDPLRHDWLLVTSRGAKTIEQMLSFRDGGFISRRIKSRAK